MLGRRRLALRVQRVLLDRDVAAVGPDVEHDGHGFVAEGLRAIDGVHGIPSSVRACPRLSGPLNASSLATSCERTPATTGANAVLSSRTRSTVPRPRPLRRARSPPGLEPAGIALEERDAADDVDGGRPRCPVDGLGARGRSGVTALDEGQLGLGRGGGVVDLPRLRGGHGVLVEGRGARAGVRRRAATGVRPATTAGAAAASGTPATSLLRAPSALLLSLSRPGASASHGAAPRSVADRPAGARPAGPARPFSPGAARWREGPHPTNTCSLWCRQPRQHRGVTPSP